MKLRIVDRKKFIRIVVIILLLISIVILIVKMPKIIEYKETYKVITVLGNETLWNIAEEYKKPSQDIRDYIYKIKELNNMDDSMIYKGQELTIILYEEVK